MSELELLRNLIEEIDKDMAVLFEKRMDCVKKIAEYKSKNGMQVSDSKREEELIEKMLCQISNNALKPYYAEFIKNNIEISKKYQQMLLKGEHL